MIIHRIAICGTPAPIQREVFRLSTNQTLDNNATPPSFFQCTVEANQVTVLTDSKPLLESLRNHFSNDPSAAEGTVISVDDRSPVHRTPRR